MTGSQRRRVRCVSDHDACQLMPRLMIAARLRFTSRAPFTGNSSLLLLAALVLIAAGLAVSPPAAQAACIVSGGQGGDSPSEWSLTVTSSHRVTCSQAKRVMRVCGEASVVPGWRVTDVPGIDVKFTRRGNKSRWFRAYEAGGSPRCLERLARSTVVRRLADARMAARTRYRLRACGTISASTEGVSARERIRARGMSCHRAREMIRASNAGGATPGGYRCVSSGEGSFCARTFSLAARLSSKPSIRPNYRYAQGDFRV